MNDNGFNFHSQGFRSFDDILKDFDFGRGNDMEKNGSFLLVVVEVDLMISLMTMLKKKEDDDFFVGFKFGGFGDSFFCD